MLPTHPSIQLNGLARVPDHMRQTSTSDACCPAYCIQVAWYLYICLVRIGVGTMGTENPRAHSLTRPKRFRWS